MGAIKTNDYTNQQEKLALIGRAVAHPARIKMLELFSESEVELRNTDLARILDFTSNTVKGHIWMMRDAGILEVEYEIHCYRIRLNRKGMEWANKLLS